MGTPQELILRVEALCAEAEKWVGTKESGGENKGPEVEAFQKAVDGVAQGEPWCMAFVQYCLKAVGGCDLPVSERVMTVWEKAPAELKISAPERGCLAIWRQKHGTAGHTGIVLEVLSDTQVRTVEGNTTSGVVLDREGDGVYRRDRAIRPVMGSLEIVGWLRCWLPPKPEEYGPAF